MGSETTLLTDAKEERKGNQKTLVASPLMERRPLGEAVLVVQGTTQVLALVRGVDDWATFPPNAPLGMIVMP